MGGAGQAPQVPEGSGPGVQVPEGFEGKVILFFFS